MPDPGWQRQGQGTARTPRGRRCSLLAALLCSLAAPARGEPALRPLDVPSGTGPTPEQQAELAPQERIERGAAALAQRGYAELPVLALALMDDGASPAALDRAVELSPGVPALRIEAAWQRRNPRDLVAALAGLVLRFPCASWLVALLGAAAVASLALTAAGLAGFAFLRSASLHVHALGHKLGPVFEPAAAIGLIAAVSAVPALGGGPAAVVLLLAILGALRLPARSAAACAGAVALACAAAGPGLEWWGRLAMSPAADPALGAAWRIERAQPLPGDAALLEGAVAERPDDLVYRLALATYYERIGDLKRAAASVEPVPLGAPAALQARATNLAGVLALASGDLDGALRRFERARTIDESAAVLYNLSQAHARNLALDKREKLFASARNLDPDLVSRYASRSGSSIHDYLIQEPIPARFLLARLFAPSELASAFAEELQVRLLGFAAPSWLWLALAAAVAAAPWLRLGDQLRCRRCDRPLCSHCAPAAAAAQICARCERIVSSRGRAEARLRQEQADADDHWQQRLRWQRAGLSVLLPGIGSWLGGRPFLGCARVWAVGFALALPWAARALPEPFEVGRLAEWLPRGAALACGAAMYVWAFADAHAWLAGRRS